MASAILQLFYVVVSPKDFIVLHVYKAAWKALQEQSIGRDSMFTGFLEQYTIKVSCIHRNEGDQIEPVQATHAS